jgi:exodeoxyribonuclease VII large subunit
VSLVNEPDKISPEKIFKISEINRLAKNLLQSHLPKLWISGEVSNFIEATSGHWYFSLKDSQAQIKCTMFRGHNQFASIKPKNGDLIEAFGSEST